MAITSVGNAVLLGGVFLLLLLVPRYLISSSGVGCLHRASLRHRLLPVEDVFVAGVLADACAMPRYDDGRAFLALPFDPCGGGARNLSDLALLHLVGPNLDFLRRRGMEEERVALPGPREVVEYMRKEEGGCSRKTTGRNWV